MTWDCVQEKGGVWHIARVRGRTLDFIPIRCSTDDEGITLPGIVERREPTCPECRAVVRLPAPPST